MCWTVTAALGVLARTKLIGTASPSTSSGRIHLGRRYDSGGGGGGGGGSKKARSTSYGITIDGDHHRLGIVSPRLGIVCPLLDRRGRGHVLPRAGLSAGTGHLRGGDHLWFRFCLPFGLLDRSLHRCLATCRDGFLGYSFSLSAPAPP